MKKLTSLVYLVNNNFILFIVMSLCQISTAFSQDSDKLKDYQISSYLEKPTGAKYPTITLDRPGKMNEDQKLINSIRKIVLVNRQSLYLNLDKYKLKKADNFFEIGTGKIGQDSVYYFSIPGQIDEYYKIKKNCSIKFLGYNYTKYTFHHRQHTSFIMYFSLKSSCCRLCFSLNIGRLDIIIEQYDRF